MFMEPRFAIRLKRETNRESFDIEVPVRAKEFALWVENDLKRSPDTARKYLNWIRKADTTIFGDDETDSFLLLHLILTATPATIRSVKWFIDIEIDIYDIFDGVCNCDFSGVSDERVYCFYLRLAGGVVQCLVEHLKDLCDDAQRSGDTNLQTLRNYRTAYSRYAEFVWQLLADRHNAVCPDNPMKIPGIKRREAIPMEAEFASWFVARYGATHNSSFRKYVSSLSMLNEKFFRKMSPRGIDLLAALAEEATMGVDITKVCNTITRHLQAEKTQPLICTGMTEGQIEDASFAWAGYYVPFLHSLNKHNQAMLDAIVQRL